MMHDGRDRQHEEVRCAWIRTSQASLLSQLAAPQSPHRSLTTVSDARRCQNVSFLSTGESARMPVRTGHTLLPTPKRPGMCAKRAPGIRLFLGALLTERCVYCCTGDLTVLPTAQMNEIRIIQSEAAKVRIGLANTVYFFKIPVDSCSPSPQTICFKKI